MFFNSKCSSLRNIYLTDDCNDNGLVSLILSKCKLFKMSYLIIYKPTAFKLPSLLKLHIV